MKKILFTIFTVLIAHSVNAINTIGDLKIEKSNTILVEDPGCLADAIMIYDATYDRTGDMERSLDNANAFYDACTE